MITITTPGQSDLRYAVFQDFLIGPYSPMGSGAGSVTTLRSYKDQITSAGHSIWGEKGVSHFKVTADIKCHSDLGNFYPYANDTDYPKYPDRMRLDCYSYTGAAKFTTVNNGLAWHGRTSVCFVRSNLWEHVAIENTNNDPSLWTVYRFRGSGKSPSATWYGEVWTMKRIVASSAQYLTYDYTYEYRGSSNYSTIPEDMYQRQSFDTIKRYATMGAAKSQSGSQIGASWSYVKKSNTSISFYDLLGVVDTTVDDMLLRPFPIAESPFGDLAMRASEGFNANHTNMIAFLRDLRHPTELIPKLRNLRKLKTLADNYLTVKYGILPTISDVKTILGACKTVRPYLDKNGYSTYHAGKSDSAVVDNINFTSEQRIKIAVGAEDEGLISITNDIESYGFLPTLSNIWDLVPYSFAIDWLVDVGGFLERVDTRLRLLRHGIKYATQSRKTSASTSLNWTKERPYIGQVKWEQYHRWVSDQCPVPPLSLHSEVQLQDHWIEAGALIIQRKF